MTLNEVLGRLDRHRAACRFLPGGAGILCLAIVSVWTFAAAAPAATQTRSAFTVSNVHVDVTSKTAADARKKALAEGEKRAFQRLLRRLTLSEDRSRLPQLSQQDIAEYISDFSVSNAKNSTVRYLADLSYRFKPGEVRGLLRDLDIDFAETLSKAVLVLPVYEAAGAMSLWDDPNPWRNAWNDLPESDGLVPMILPGGDLQDVRSIGAEQAVGGDEPRIKAIGNRYNVSTVAVAHARLDSTGRGRPRLKVNIFPYGSDSRGQAFELEFEFDGRRIEDLLSNASARAAANIEDKWKEENLIQYEQNAVLAATLPIRSLTDWVDARKRLAKIAVIERIDLVLFSRNEARLNIYYLGLTQQLALALAQADIKLIQNEGNWTLQLLKAKKSAVRATRRQRPKGFQK